MIKSQIVTMPKLKLMYYTNFIAFMRDSQKDKSATVLKELPPASESLLVD